MILADLPPPCYPHERRQIYRRKRITDRTGLKGSIKAGIIRVIHSIRGVFSWE